MAVGVAVSYCSLEAPFLRHVLRECLKFAAHVVVGYCATLHNGAPDDLTELHRAKEAFPDVTFVEYAVDRVDELMDAPSLANRAAYWPNRARWECVKALRDECDWVLFLDADEVPEGERMAAFVRQLPAPHADAPALKLANYWYLRSPTLRYRGIEDSAVLAPRHRVRTRDAVVLCEQERNDLAREPVLRSVSDGHPTPMIHHFSWVRSPEDLVTKVRGWSHRGDRDWEAAVRQELARPITSNHVDVIFGRAYDTVPAPFGITV